jgi:hypothetical protein
MFYQHLSHPSIRTLNRHYVAPDEGDVSGIDAAPTVAGEEAVEALSLMCLAAGRYRRVRGLVESNARIEAIAGEASGADQPYRTRLSGLWRVTTEPTTDTQAALTRRKIPTFSVQNVHHVTVQSCLAAPFLLP